MAYCQDDACCLDEDRACFPCEEEVLLDASEGLDDALPDLLDEVLLELLDDVQVVLDGVKEGLHAEVVDCIGPAEVLDEVLLDDGLVVLDDEEGLHVGLLDEVLQDGAKELLHGASGLLDDELLELLDEVPQAALVHELARALEVQMDALIQSAKVLVLLDDPFDASLKAGRGALVGYVALSEGRGFEAEDDWLIGEWWAMLLLVPPLGYEAGRKARGPLGLGMGSKEPD